MISYCLHKQLRTVEKLSLTIHFIVILLIFHSPLQLGACGARIAQAHAAQLSIALIIYNFTSPSPHP